MSLIVPNTTIKQDSRLKQLSIRRYSVPFQNSKGEKQIFTIHDKQNLQAMDIKKMIQSQIAKRKITSENLDLLNQILLEAQYAKTEIDNSLSQQVEATQKKIDFTTLKDSAQNIKQQLDGAKDIADIEKAYNELYTFLNSLISILNKNKINVPYLNSTLTKINNTLTYATKAYETYKDTSIENKKPLDMSIRTAKGRRVRGGVSIFDLLAGLQSNYNGKVLETETVNFINQSISKGKTGTISQGYEAIDLGDILVYSGTASSGHVMTKKIKEDIGILLNGAQITFTFKEHGQNEKQIITGTIADLMNKQVSNTGTVYLDLSQYDELKKQIVAGASLKNYNAPYKIHSGLTFLNLAYMTPTCIAAWQLVHYEQLAMFNNKKVETDADYLEYYDALFRFALAKNFAKLIGERNDFLITPQEGVVSIFDYVANAQEDKILHYTPRRFDFKKRQKYDILMG